MKLLSTLFLFALASTGLAESITTIITATKNGHVYTKTVTQDATFVWTGEGSAATSSVTAASVSISSAAVSSAETSSATSSAVSSAEPSSADEGSGSSITTVITATKNGHVYTKTVTQDATFVWAGEGSAATSTATSPVSSAVTSAEPSSAVSTAEPSSANEGSGSRITTVITATKNGHVYTKTVTQDATFVWAGEGSAATSAVPSATVSSANVSSAADSTVSSLETSTANEGSGSSITTVVTATKNGNVYTKTVTQDATCVGVGESSPTTSAVSSAAPVAVSSAAAALSSVTATFGAVTSGSSSATISTSTNNGHVYSKIVTQDASFFWNGEGSNAWAPSTSTSAEIVSKASATTVATSATAKSSSTAQIASYTGAADAITAGTGLMGAALAFIIFL